MQGYVEISSSTTLASSLSQILSNDKTALSCSSGTVFPTSSLQIGMLCFRADLNKLYILKNLTPTWLLLLDVSTTTGAAVTELVNSVLVRNSGLAGAGGSMVLQKPVSGSTLVGNLTFDVFNNLLKIYDTGGTNKGFVIDLSLGAASSVTKIWHDANDGAGSGLDADLLDGLQGSSYATAASVTTLTGSLALTNAHATTTDGNVTALTTVVNGKASIGGSSSQSFATGSLSTGNVTTLGDITATGDVTAYFSDDRLKDRLKNIDNALAKVSQLSGFYYEANDVAQSLGYKARREVGVSAQEVQSVLPEVVVPAPIDSQYLTVRYERMIPLLIEAIKELNNKVTLLESK